MPFNRPTTSAAPEHREYRQLLTAAASLLLTRGYAATSIGRICLRADITPGRFAAHLGRKSDAAHAVAAHLTRHAVDRIDGFTPRDGRHLLATLTTWTRLLTTRPGWIWLELDLTDLDPPSRAKVYTRADRLRRALTHLLARSPWLDVPDRSDSEREQLVSLLFTLALGMAIQHNHGTHIHHRNGALPPRAGPRHQPPRPPLTSNTTLRTRSPQIPTNFEEPLWKPAQSNGSTPPRASDSSPATPAVTSSSTTPKSRPRAGALSTRDSASSSSEAKVRKAPPHSRFIRCERRSSPHRLRAGYRGHRRAPARYRDPRPSPARGDGVAVDPWLRRHQHRQDLPSRRDQLQHLHQPLRPQTPHRPRSRRHLATRAIHRISRTIPRDTDHLITTLAIWASILATRPGWVSLELALAALDDTSRTEVSDRIGVIGDALTEMLTATTSFDTSRPRIDVDLVVSFLFTVVIGMSVQHANGIQTTISGIRPHIELILRAAQLP